MPEHLQYEEDDLFNPDTAHEHSDVPVKALLMFIVIFIVGSVISYFLILLFYKGLAKAERSRLDPPQTAVQRPANADIPQNQPLLQPFLHNGSQPQADTPVVDLIKMRAREDQVLRNYGWVDEQKGVVHIPIDKAKELLAAKIAVESQVATQPAPAAATTTTTTAGGTQ